MRYVRRSSLVVLGLVALYGACGEPTGPGTPSSITVQPASNTLTALGLTLQFTAVAKDADGNTVSDVSFVWRSSVASIATVDDTGRATATANGTTTITASANNVSGSAELMVAQAPAALEQVSGAGQVGTAGEALGDTLQVKASDAMGSPVAGIDVVWMTADEQDGALSDDTTTTGTDGVARNVWTLGPRWGQQSATASVAGLSPVAFTATATYDPQDTLVVALDESMSVAAKIGTEGGEVTVSDMNGAQFTLTIPAGGLLDSEFITLTPVADISGLPVSGGLLAAVQLEPDGLTLLVPATLTVELASAVPAEELVGFGYRGDGHEFHFDLVEVSGTTLSFSVAHFSGQGVAQGSAADCEFQGVPATPEDRAKQRISCVFKRAIARNPELLDFSSQDIADIEAAFTDWFNDAVKVDLEGARNCWTDPACGDADAYLRLAVSGLFGWMQVADLMPGEFTEFLLELEAMGLSLMAQMFETAIVETSKLCGVTDVIDERRSVEDYLFRLQWYIDLIGVGALHHLVMTESEVRTTCGFLRVDPAWAPVLIGWDFPLRAIMTDLDGSDIELTGEQVEWSSTNTAVTVTAGQVTGSGVGTTTIVATFGPQEAHAVIEVWPTPYTFPGCTRWGYKYLHDFHPTNPDIIACLEPDEQALRVGDRSFLASNGYAPYDWDEHPVYWSPDGTRVLLFEEEGGLYVVSIPENVLTFVVEIPCACRDADSDEVYGWVNNSTIRYRTNSDDPWRYAIVPGS